MVSRLSTRKVTGAIGSNFVKTWSMYASVSFVEGEPGSSVKYQVDSTRKTYPKYSKPYISQTGEQVY